MKLTRCAFALAALASGALLHAQTAQTFAAWKGAYSYVEQGINATGQRYSRIGILELDGTGAALASDVTKTAGAAATARLSGSYQPMDDGAVEVKLFTTSTNIDEDQRPVPPNGTPWWKTASPPLPTRYWAPWNGPPCRASRQRCW